MKSFPAAYFGFDDEALYAAVCQMVDALYTRPVKVRIDVPPSRKRWVKKKRIFANR